MPLKEVKVSPNGTRFPFNPLNGFISRSKEGFAGCFGCGSEQYIFASYPGRRATALNELFFQESISHIPCSWLTSRNKMNYLKFTSNLIQVKSVVIFYVIY